MGGRLLNFPISRVGTYSRMGAKSNKYSSHIYFNEERKKIKEKHKKIKQQKKKTSCGILRENIKLERLMTNFAHTFLVIFYFDKNSVFQVQAGLSLL